MYARVATFESDPAKVDDAIAMVRDEVDGEVPPGLEGAKMLMLVNRETGKGLGVTLFETEDAMRRGDEALNAMDPGSTERRVRGGAGLPERLGTSKWHTRPDLNADTNRAARPVSDRDNGQRASGSRPGLEVNPDRRSGIAP